MARFYVNENFPFPAVDELRKLGHDTLTMLEESSAGLALRDEEVLIRATKLNRIVITLNRKHFIHLHKSNPSHSGIIVCTFDPDFVRLSRNIDGAIASTTSMENKLLRVNRI